MRSPSSTYIKCEQGDSFTLQIPSSKGCAAKIESSRAVQFSVTMEVLFTRLPPKGQLAAMLRSMPEELSRSKHRHAASLYLTDQGLLAPHAGTADCVGAQKIGVEAWHVVTVCIDAAAERLVVYVDGKKSMEATGQKDLHLQKNLGVLGGGKQAQARGGGVRRVFIHEQLLDEAQAAALEVECRADIDAYKILQEARRKEAEEEAASKAKEEEEKRKEDNDDEGDDSGEEESE